MTENIVIAKKWGNSVGFVIPGKIVKKENIKPNDKVILSVRKLSANK
ncbi:MAG: AbrB/MazE/SpoVT family DNA-binding domain-containing protein [Candidatus Diapherotrites archaeon]|nr:AbrB/MazE/SpoVT family DNA-binding domain-containing protein [Candidatus Diapherotrites archaeon]